MRIHVTACDHPIGILSTLSARFSHYKFHIMIAWLIVPNPGRLPVGGVAIRVATVSVLAVTACSSTPASSRASTGSAPRPSVVAPIESTVVRAEALSEPATADAAPDATPIQPPADAVAGNEEPFAGSVFPPANFSPPHERSAKPGDGVWQRMGDAVTRERAADEPAVVYRTVVHPHPVSKFITVTIAAIDLKHTMVRWIPGTQEPELNKLPSTLTPGLVPSHDQANLLVVFNGGFKAQHGGWGMKVDNVVLVKPRSQGCTIVLSGVDVRMGSWNAVESYAESAATYRQTTPCLVESGVLNPRLEQGNQRAWGGNTADVTTRRRTAIGLDASGRVLLFAMGEEADPRLLGQALQYAGAVHAAQLDINWNWTRFLLFGGPPAQPSVTSTLIPQMVHRKRGYVEHPVDRDFFYVTRR